jgi:uncharacterized membrane protein
MNAIEPAAPGNVVAPAASAMVAEASAVVPARCKNCDAVLLGRFCSNCSQAANVHVPTTMELMHELLEGITHSDSRLWRTLKTLWLKPGKLTTEFVAGRRIAYLPPFRLYLILSIIFFLMLSLVHTNVELIKFDEALKPGGSATNAATPSKMPISSCLDLKVSDRPAWTPRLQHICEAIRQDSAENLLHVAIGTMSKAMFIFLPLVAFLHMLIYWRPRYRYAEQLLFFVHLHAFYFSIAILLVVLIEAANSWPRIDGVSGILQTLLGWTLPVYTLIAMRKVFRRSWMGTLFKAVVLFFIYVTVFALTVVAVFVYSVLQL